MHIYYMHFEHAVVLLVYVKWYVWKMLMNLLVCIYTDKYSSALAVVLFVAYREKCYCVFLWTLEKRAVS